MTEEEYDYRLMNEEDDWYMGESEFDDEDDTESTAEDATHRTTPAASEDDESTNFIYILFVIACAVFFIGCFIAFLMH